MRFPQILKLNKAGMPHDWITYQDAVYHICKGNVLWAAGTNEINITGGVNRISGEQSRLAVNSILAIDGKISPKTFMYAPSISNDLLFRRDGKICAYCNNKFSDKSLTRDHIVPVSKGGKNTWDNVITSCKPCNNTKSDTLLQELGWSLGFQPYTPTAHEHIMLLNFGLLDDQYDFLIKHVGVSSRMPTLLNRPGGINIEKDNKELPNE